MVDLNDFEIEIECYFKDEHYSVRDNGSVLRHTPPNKRIRPVDNQWTFGKVNIKKGYLEIASVSIHRIVATAFHGQPPTKEHIVDHIDTNKQNNRPDNLRWVTRLENVLLNPITVKRIEISCGCSIEEFLADPSKFRNKFQEPNYEWMSTVSIKEAQESIKRLLAWAESDKFMPNSSLREWIFNRDNILKERKIEHSITENNNSYLTMNEKIEEVFARVEKETGISKSELSSKSKIKKYYNTRVLVAKQLRSELGLNEEKIGSLLGRSKSMINAYFNTPDYIHNGNNENNSFLPSEIQFNNNINNIIITSSLTTNAKQKNWKTPSIFPFCPQIINNNPINDYVLNLQEGKTFSQNNFSNSIIEDYAISKDEKTFWVLCRNIDDNAMKPYTLTEVTFQNNLFIHNSLGSFFEKDGAKKQFIIAQGLEWTGGEAFDDFC